MFHETPSIILIVQSYINLSSMYSEVITSKRLIKGFFSKRIFYSYDVEKDIDMYMYKCSDALW